MTGAFAAEGADVTKATPRFTQGIDFLSLELFCFDVVGHEPSDQTSASNMAHAVGEVGAASAD